MKIKKTVSDKVIAANRRNARKSTGPRNAAAKSALKYHSVKHGLLTKTLLFEGHKEEAEFQELTAELEADYRPRGSTKMKTVSQSIMRQRRSSLSRRNCFENSSAVSRVRMIHCFSSQASPFPNFLAMSPLMKYGKACCRLRAILE
jgi:hypothetical protein